MGRDSQEDFGLAPGERFEPDDAGSVEPFNPRQPHAMTVGGPIAPDQLGVTLPWEYLRTGAAPAKPDRGPGRGPNAEQSTLAALAALEDFDAAGGRAIVDATSIAADRDVRTLAWISARSPVHLIAVTGVAARPRAGTAGYAPRPEALVGGLVRELRDGIAGSEVRAGAILVALDAADEDERDGQDGQRGRWGLRAAALAQAETGAPLVLQAAPGSDPIAALLALQAEGIDPSRVMVGRPGDTLGGDELRGVLALGATVVLSGIARSEAAEDGAAAAVMTALGAGHGQRVLLSLGWAAGAGDGPAGWSWMLDRFSLRLMEAGLDAAAVRRLLVDNPARALTVRR